MSPPEQRAARILVVDDEPQIRRFLEIGLRAQGYCVQLARSGQEGLEALALNGADLVVLDMGLPDRDGLEVLAALREWSTVPVIMLTVRADESDKVAALDAGANDYVTKPFGVQELMARVRALLRSRPAGEEGPAAYEYRGLRIDPARREVSVDGVAVSLTRKEFALLAVLARHAGRVVTQPQLLREVWGDSHSHDTHYLRIVVGRLRQKLGDSATAPRWLVTEPGVGLKLLA
ncbi:response regulator transcription factor [Pseudomarimonas salicorniae]|uniref:Response regulator transcription factor n=1 Tax=Pseudomarimonas salicorniae TaxID=2933270 RepID=A0ABT0GIH8_9GAMM|nr:response regulator transcription factor [Lysobacter sp. CAU 1642]MCK7594238.1 response regulator transcription factor [Lysobacter sp. CAU 1642]